MVRHTPGRKRTRVSVAGLQPGCSDQRVQRPKPPSPETAPTPEDCEKLCLPLPFLEATRPWRTAVGSSVDQQAAGSSDKEV